MWVGRLAAMGMVIVAQKDHDWQQEMTAEKDW